MHRLNLPEFEPRTRESKNGKSEIFDPVRKRFVRLTPEEWVRQSFLNFMTVHLGYPASLIVVEAELTYNQMKKRFDILACLADGSPCLVVECKAPSVEITQAVFDQVAMYNMTLLVEYVLVTNGLAHYTCRIDHEKRSYTFLKEIPDYDLVRQGFPGN
ncbi:MAG: type I restriction enzyme HsdR N-terminal domain-containing protein [Bacteroidota bacterium]